MNKENTLKLFEDFPRLYRGHQCGLMPYGFECGDGWFDLIYKLSADIEKTARDAGLPHLSEQWPRATQVKNKFGSLRFHFHVRSLGEDDFGPVRTLIPLGPIEPSLAECIKTIRALIADANERSAGICDECGLTLDGCVCQPSSHD